MEDQVAVELQTSSDFIGRWNHLVSTTNWEKGRIICQWRAALQAAGASSLAYTDEAWSQQVGGVSPQHVGRLRRAFERFGEVHDQYVGLYWSHFHAAIDWHDAEMYLEGAVQNDWSVSQMRQQRAEAIGSPEPMPSDAESALEMDDGEMYGDEPIAASLTESFSDVRDAEPLDDDSRLDESNRKLSEAAAHDSATATTPTDKEASPSPLRPFESLPKLPPDVNEAFELMKLAILAHKVTGWQEIARDDVLAVLESLKRLALAPAE